MPAKRCSRKPAAPSIAWRPVPRCSVRAVPGAQRHVLPAAAGRRVTCERGGTHFASLLARYAHLVPPASAGPTPRHMRARARAHPWSPQAATPLNVAMPQTWNVAACSALGCGPPSTFSTGAPPTAPLLDTFVGGMDALETRMGPPPDDGGSDVTHYSLALCPGTPPPRARAHRLSSLRNAFRFAAHAQMPTTNFSTRIAQRQ